MRQEDVVDVNIDASLYDRGNTHFLHVSSSCIPDKDSVLSCMVVAMLYTCM